MALQYFYSGRSLTFLCLAIQVLVWEALSDFVATDVVIHQQQSQVQRQPADLHRSLEQPHGPVQRQLRRFFLRSRHVRVMNR